MKRIYASIIFLMMAVAVFAQTDGNGSGFNEMVAIVESRLGSGTGFLVRTEDAVWLYTNEHVLRGGLPVKARLMNGLGLKIRELQIAQDRDVARIKIEGVYPGFRIADKMPEIGVSVSVVGNSDGAGVGTLLTGRVLGVGPEEVEVSAEFVPGNSGSPIIEHGGDVIAVATYVTRGKTGSDWTKAGTRFEQVRRFGVRMDGVLWKSVDWKKYDAQAKLLTSVNTFMDVMYFACFSKKMLLHEYQDLWKIKTIGKSSVSSELRSIMNFDKHYQGCLDKMSKAQSGYKNMGLQYSAAYYNETTLNQYGKKYEKEFYKAKQDADRKGRDSIHQRQIALRNVMRKLSAIKFDSEHQRRIAQSYLSELQLMLDQYEKDFKWSLGYFHD